MWEQTTNPTPCGLSAKPSPVQHPPAMLLKPSSPSLCKLGSAPNNLTFVFDSLIFPFLQTDTFQIIVSIINLNDNTPVFKQTSLTITLPEVRVSHKWRGHWVNQCYGTRERSSANCTEKITTTLFQDTKVNATIIPREDLSASDADLDNIYYELNSTVQVSIFLWGEKKKKKK